MDPATFVRLQVYFVTSAVASLLLAFVVHAAGGDRGYAVSLARGGLFSKEALLTAFVANSAFIVLPILVENVKNALMRAPRAENAGRRIDGRSGRADLVCRSRTPVKLLTLLFVPLRGLAGRRSPGHRSYLACSAAGIPSYFAKAQVALPFLMDLLGVPHDLLQPLHPVEHRHRQVRFDSTVMSLLALALIGGQRQ